jgi:hypothetical protein
VEGIQINMTFKNRHLKTSRFITLSLMAWFGRISSIHAETNGVDYALFKDPPAEYRGICWMGFNLSNLSEDGIVERVRSSAQSGSWGSFLLGPGGGPTTGLSEAYLRGSGREPSTQGVTYLSEEFFRLYRAAIEEGLKNGFPLSTLYDEWNYPSGIVGGQFYSRYPELAAKSIELAEKNVTGPAKAELAIPAGAYVGAVMMNRDTRERIDVSDRKTDKNVLKCRVPKGEWKIMAFYLNDAFRPASQKGGFVDYLDRGAVAKYIELNFDPYDAHLKEFFGTVIKRTMYDEPAMHLMDGRMWTFGFNREFTKKRGYSPMTLYPALWYDIGPETAAARNALFGFNAELFAENYIGQLAEWCGARGIKLGGHLDQEEARNPVAISGDLMKAFEHQHVPGHDDIYFPGRSLVSYKIVASAAYNYDRPECFAETYAAYRLMTPVIWMRAALDQFAMGINVQLGTRPRETGPEMDRLVGRMGYLLRGGRHVADVAVLYPIAALQAAYAFASPPTSSRRGSSPGFYYALEGGILPPEIDYMDLGEMLYRALRVDYTYLHPEVLVGRCSVEKQALVLNNKENREEFRVLILPGGETLSADAAKKVLEFYRGGGTIIATRKLPSRSAEFGRDKEVREMSAEVFGISNDNPMTAEISIVVDDFKSYFMNRNHSGGRGYFLPQPDIQILNSVLKEADPVRDVDIQETPMGPLKTGTNYEGALTYIHKVKENRDIYFFSNSTNNPIDAKVVLRGDKNLAIWNPHTGERQNAEVSKSETAGQPVTTVRLVLPPVRSTFFVQE